MALSNNVLNVTGLDFTTIRTNLESYISTQTDFTDYDFEGSTISNLLDLLAYNTYYNAIYTNMASNEMFLDSAQVRANVVSRAKMLGYTPTSARGATATVQVNVTPPSPTDNFNYLDHSKDTMIYGKKISAENIRRVIRKRLHCYKDFWMD